MMSVPQRRTLLLVAGLGPLALTELGTILGRNAGVASLSVDALARRGFVTFEEDGRVVVTDKGARRAA